MRGTLYGTTSGGGASYCAEYQYNIFCGTIFRITTGGAEKVLYSFSQGHHPNTPVGGLIDAGGKLYGTTQRGGKHGFGTVFSITLGGKLKVLHSFGSGTDGKNPRAALIDGGGTLYGTTENGGAYGCDNGCGTVFSITPGGTEKVLHSFGNGSDGEYPEAALIDVKGTLYGTTSKGGEAGAGTVFSITTSGTEQVLHSFQVGSSSDGRLPVASLTDVNGTLYGTTYRGGTYENGTVFALTP